jgi:hypothetical protein
MEIRVPCHLIFTLDISGYILRLLSRFQSMKPISARLEHILIDQGVLLATLQAMSGVCPDPVSGILYDALFADSVARSFRRESLQRNQNRVICIIKRVVQQDAAEFLIYWIPSKLTEHCPFIIIARDASD